MTYLEVKRLLSLPPDSPGYIKAHKEAERKCERERKRRPDNHLSCYECITGACPLALSGELPLDGLEFCLFFEPVWR